MLIKSKLHRNGGTPITFGKGREAVHYHFKPADPKAKLDDITVDHVCDVTDPAHLAKLLAIPEGYEVHESEIKGKKAAAKTPDPEPDADDHSDASSNAGNADDAVDYSDKSAKDLAALVKAKTGKAPKPGTSKAKMIETLTA